MIRTQIATELTMALGTDLFNSCSHKYFWGKEGEGRGRRRNKKRRISFDTPLHFAAY